MGIRDQGTGRILTARRRPELLSAAATYDDDLPVDHPLPNGDTWAIPVHRRRFHDHRLRGRVHPTDEQRRRKHSALRDVAAMTQSFHYAAMLGLREMLKAGALGERSYEDVEPFANVWHTWSSSAYLKGYLEAPAKPRSCPRASELKVLVDAFRLEERCGSWSTTSSHRPDLLQVPMTPSLESWRTRPMNEPKMMGAEPLGQRVPFRVWAPKARHMSVKIVAPDPQLLTMERGADDVFRPSRPM